jgi:hypothetical protein
VQVRGGRLYAFMPPVKRIEDLPRWSRRIENTRLSFQSLPGSKVCRRSDPSAVSVTP